jgi:hypothetical protein
MDRKGSDQVGMWDLDDGNGNYDVVTMADIKRWELEEERKKSLKSLKTIKKGDDVPY